MKKGDLVTYKRELRTFGVRHEEIFVVRRVELKNNWLFIYNNEIPFQMNLFEVISEGR